MKEGLLELKRSSKAKKIHGLRDFMAYEISQPKEAPAKMALGCKIISQPK